ncbi:MAG: hypothetical protein N2422_06145 [Rhodobacteraceae bacterium]|nr:hypothetical protein [Paracoccaceae bacterium]
MPLSGWERTGPEDPVYKACLAGVTAFGAGAGIIVGGFGSVQTLGLSFAAVPAGIALGFAAGVQLCPYFAPVIRRKLETGEGLLDREVRAAAEAMGAYAGVSRADDALQLLALTVALAPRTSGAPRCTNPPAAARQLLAVGRRTA